MMRYLMINSDLVKGLTNATTTFPIEEQQVPQIKPLFHESQVPWWKRVYTPDPPNTIEIGEILLQQREEAEFEDDPLYIAWQQQQAILKIKNNRIGVVTLDAAGEFTYVHNLGFSDYVVLVTPLDEAMPSLYIEATENQISVKGGVNSGKVQYIFEFKE